jgi:hypothetical protein
MSRAWWSIALVATALSVAHGCGADGERTSGGISDGSGAALGVGGMALGGMGGMGGAGGDGGLAGAPNGGGGGN